MLYEVQPNMRTPMSCSHAKNSQFHPEKLLTCVGRAFHVRIRYWVVTIAMSVRRA